MLKGGNPLTVGVGIVIEVIRKNNSDYDPEVGAEANAIPSSRDPIYLGTLLRMFAQRVPDFMELILSPNHTVGGGDGPVTIRRKELDAAFGGKIEPLGFDRFKTCELMAELLHCSNMGLLNEVGSEEFVKARDVERERLKAEGRLAIFPNSPTLADEGLTMKSSTQTRLGSPDGTRKLEVQNASDDDGFEEVTHAADLGDDAKDDFDEKPGEEDLLTSSRPAPLSFDRDDEDFVDEPLSSPRVDHAELANVEPLSQDAPAAFEPGLMPQPLSPTKDLAQKVDSLGIQGEDTTMDDANTSGNVVQSETTDSVPASIVTEAAEHPIVTEIHEEMKADLEGAEHVSAIAAQPDLETLPHQEDKPAPLFTKSGDSTSDTPEQPAPESQIGTESLDTTMGEAGDSSNLVAAENIEEQNQSVLMEDGVGAVVGDFLKMQFVEHKVVPTILVSIFQPPHKRFIRANVCRTSSSGSLGIISCIM